MNEYERRGRWAAIDEIIENLHQKSLIRADRHCHMKPDKLDFAVKANALVQLIESLPEDE